MDDERHRRELAERITGQLARRHSTATVLFHHAVAERLGLGPADHKCLDLLLDRGSMTGSQLAAITGLTTGAVTGVVARLERAGYVERRPDPADKRKQIISLVPERVRDVQEVFAAATPTMAAVLDGFDAVELAAIATFLERVAEVNLQRAAAMRAQLLAGGGRSAVSATHNP
jgi:DNA-binding MarR family transcriptional regulator